MPANWKRIITTGDDSNYKNSNISSSDIPSNAITQAKIADEAVGADQIEANSISGGHFEQGAVNNGAIIANDIIDSQHYKDGSIDNAHLANSSVTGDKLTTNAVSTSAKLNTGVVTTAKIADDAVTNAKVANDAIRIGQIDTSNSSSVGQYLQASPTTQGLTWVSLSISNSNWNGTDLSVANGGTGASSASTARGKNNLDVNQAGHHGYPTRIKILPSDLRPDDDVSTSNIALRSAYYGGSASVMHQYLEAFASFNIPSGFKATSTTLYTSVNLAFAVYKNDINTSGGTYLGNGTATSSGGTSNHTDLTANDTNYLTIRLDFTATSQLFYGGYITIARV